MALNTLPNAGLTNRGYPSDRIVTPIIINGDMSVAQRGTSFSFNGSSGYTVDRFNFTQTSGATGDCTITQEADAPSNTGLVKSVKIAVDTAETPTSSGNCVFEQGIEGFNCAPLEHGQSSPPSATLSFWVKSNKTGTYSVQIKAQGSTGRYVLFDYTISSANTWEKKTITWVGDTSIALNYDNSNQLRVIWHLSSGPDDKVSPTSSWVTSSSLQMSSNAVNFFDSASNEIYLTGVQLEVGEFDSTSIPSFPFESFENNLLKCQRYFETFPSNSGDGVIGFGYGSGSDTARTMFPFKVTKRATPTMSDSLSSSRQYRINFMNGSGTATNQNSTSTPSFGTISTLNSGYMNLAGFSSIGGGLFGFLIYNNNTTLLSADAEL
jgi:hypothetical protein